MDPLRSPKEFSTQARVPLPTVYKWQSERTGPPFIKVGRHVRYRQSAIDDWFAAHTVEPRPAA